MASFSYRDPLVISKRLIHYLVENVKFNKKIASY